MSLLFPNRVKQNSFDGPFLVNSIIKNSLFYTKFLCPLTDRQRFTLIGQKAIRAFIVCLRLESGPSAIRRFISFVIINSVKLHPFRSISHISIKVFKRLPSFTNFNSAAAIITKSTSFRILATLFHATPYSINRSRTHAMRTPKGAKSVALFTATTSSLATSQTMSANDNFVTALTAAKPPVFSFSSIYGSQDSKSLVNVTRNVFKIVSVVSKIWVSHFASIAGNLVRPTDELHFAGWPFLYTIKTEINQ